MYVITGATGNTGRSIAKTLLGLDQNVRAIGRNAKRLESLAEEGQSHLFVMSLTQRH